MTDSFVVGMFLSFFEDYNDYQNLLDIVVIVHNNVNLKFFPNCLIFLHFQESDFGADV